MSRPLRASNILLLLLLAGCSDDKNSSSSGSTDAGAGDAQANTLAIGQRYPFPKPDWTVVDPAEVGMSAADLELARQYAFDPTMNTQGVVIVRGGAIVAEWYADGKDQDSWAASWSMGKSFASALIGIALDEGLIPSVEEPMSTFFPEWANDDRGSIPLRAVLQMQSGLDYVEDYTVASGSEMIQMVMAGDSLGFARALPKLVEPDTRWYYSSGDTMLLSGVIEAVTGMNATEYARAKLFDPIGMSPVDWWTDSVGHTYAYCCVDSPSREFAKFGLLFLRNGDWDGDQVISEGWVEESTTSLASQYEGYAYQWWTAKANTSIEFPDDMYSAQGLDQQRIIVIPSLDLVIVKNTLFEKPPGAPSGSAFGGWGLSMQPRGALTYGTKAPLLWEDSVFVSHIINSIEGSTKLPAEPAIVPGATPADSAACRDALATDYGTFCEEVHGCVCDSCAQETVDCDAVPACKAILQCGIDAQCRGIECLTPCYEVIQQNGGVDGAGTQLALAASECTNACPTRACP